MKLKFILIFLFLSPGVLAENKVSNVLERYAWEKRQLIVFTPDQNFPEYIKLNQLIDQHTFELDDRNLHIWHVIKNNDVMLAKTLIDDFTNQEIRDTFKVEADEFRIILIGYDQEEKLRLEYSDFENIFFTIDQMPMRIQEIQNN